MLTKKFIPSCNQEILNMLGEELGDGADGQVFQIKSEPSKVIKVSILHDYYGDIQYRYSSLLKVFSFLQGNANDCYAKLFKYGEIVKGSVKVEDGEQKYILYYSIMERCQKITDDESKVFHSLLSHEDRNICKKLHPLKTKRILSELNKGLDFDVSKALTFCCKVHESEVLHLDLHPRNIMKREDNSFCLIDFDRCKIKNNL